MTSQRSAADNLGSHLLGRRPLPPDPRDYRLEDHLAPLPANAPTAPTGSPLDPSMTLQTVHDDTTYFSSWKGILAFWRWAKAFFANQPTPQPAPAPAPTPGADGTWIDAENVLDQGQTGHCVGFAWAQYGNTLPIDDHYTNTDGDALYYRCKVIDGEPQAEDGSNTRSGAKAMQQLGRINAYAFTTSADTISQYVHQNGPVVVGTDWTTSMFSLDADGYLRPGGEVAGGHEWLIIGYSEAGYGRVKAPSFTMLNSWSDSWGLKGRAHITKDDLQRLLDRNGDACAAVELA